MFLTFQGNKGWGGVVALKKSRIFATDDCVSAGGMENTGKNHSKGNRFLIK